MIAALIALPVRWVLGLLGVRCTCGRWTCPYDDCGGPW